MPGGKGYRQIGSIAAPDAPESGATCGMELHDERAAEQTGIVRLSLLGGFRVERDGEVVPEGAWQQRRTAKTLIKLLAITPGHTLHREQVLDYLWPDAEFESSLNSLSKALHAARYALEPTLQRRGVSSYLNLVDDVLSLDPDRVWVDVDHFEALAEAAVRSGDVSTMETALAAYAGPVLPEDRYEDWAGARREALADLHLRLSVALADSLEERGACSAALERFSQILQEDRTREDVHRRLMRLHAEQGNRHQAVKQYQLCREALRQELDVEPEAETDALYADILADRIAKRTPAGPAGQPHALPPAIRRSPSTPLVGRDRVCQTLLEELERADEGDGGMVLISGEAGVGKSRLAADLCREAVQQRMLPLWGAADEQEALLPYAPFVEALEGYVARRPAAEREALAERYPELAPLVPSLALSAATLPIPLNAEIERGYLTAALIRLLTDLSSDQTVVIVLDDLHRASSATLQLLQHLSRLAPQRRWLIVGTYCEEDTATAGELQELSIRARRADLCRHIHLRRLARQDCDEIVRALLPDGAVDAALLEQIYALSLGNPLFVEELVGAMQGREEVVLAGGVWQTSSSSTASVPRQVSTMVSVRVDRMEEDVKRVLMLSAALGARVKVGQLYAAGQDAFDAPLTETELLGILDRAVEAHILEEREDGYVFRHPLFRAALCEQMSRYRRLQVGSAVKRMEKREPMASESPRPHAARHGGAARERAGRILVGR